MKKLLDVKSIVTISLTATFIVLSLRGDLPSDFLNIYTVIIMFYFNYQNTKHLGDKKETTELRYNELNKEGE